METVHLSPPSALLAPNHNHNHKHEQDGRLLPSHTLASPAARGARPGRLQLQLPSSGSARSLGKGRNAAVQRRTAAHRLTAATASMAQEATRSTEADASFDWDNFVGFGLRDTDYMYVQKGGRDGAWQPGAMVPFGPLELSPAAGVLNYGQGVFEGLKAYRTTDGRLLLFRPEENALRMQASADRMSMPAPSVEDFVKAVKQTVLSNARWVPPAGRGSLYLRPLLIGSGPVLGLAAAPEYSFLVYASPVANYFSGAIDLKVEEFYHRAAPGGTGAAKTIGNYSPVLKTQLAAKKDGFSDVVYLDAVNNKYIEEVSSCNIFVIKDGVIATPELSRGTILPGITRKSIIELARSLGHTVEERDVSVDELMEADEVFCTGTAVVVSPVASATFRDHKAQFNVDPAQRVSQRLYDRLTRMQMGVEPDSMGWVVQLN